jgi:hypothetical protein
MNAWKTSRPLLALLALCASLSAAGEEQGVPFRQDDWEIVCDNTLACRMVGYCAEKNKHDKSGCASVLLTRAAGPNAPLAGEAALLTDQDDEQADWPPLTLQINGASQGRLDKEKARGYGMYGLTPAQTQALLAALQAHETVVFASDTLSFPLSGKGADAIFQKADATQGRVGTPGALAQKGERPEAEVFPLRPVPVIQAKKVIIAPARALSAAEVAALKPALLRSKKAPCAFDDPKAKIPLGAFTLTPVDARHVLISTLCWRGVMDNDRRAYWVMDRALKGEPEFVTAEANLYLGVVHKSEKFREAGDLSGLFHESSNERERMRHSLWIWDGQTFRLAERTLLPPAWHLSVFVSRVLKEDGTPLYSTPKPE